MSDIEAEDLPADSDIEREAEGVSPLDAARDALARARVAARDKGFRPGAPVGRRKRRPADLGSGRHTGPGKDARDPALLGDQMDHLLIERGWKVDVAAGTVQGRWPQIVGAGIADHCIVGSFTDGVLTVQAESTAWRTQLEYLESSLLARIEEEVGPGVVTAIKFVGPKGPSWSRGRLRVHGGRGPRDTYG